MEEIIVMMMIIIMIMIISALNNLNAVKLYFRQSLGSSLPARPR